MKEFNNLSVQDIESMNYNELIGIVKETNRPPGGAKSIYSIATRSFLNKDSYVLEVGTSTGFTAIELAKLVGCKVVAIDINPTSLEEARNRAQKEGVDHLITFLEKDIINSGFEDELFDLVFCGNVTSLVSDRNKALGEYVRILKKGKHLAAIPMYYVKAPGDNLVKQVSQAIRVQIQPHYKDYWMDFFQSTGLTLDYVEDYKFDTIAYSTIESFVKQILERDHLTFLENEVFQCLAKKYTEYIELFRNNNSHMGYSILLLRKDSVAIDPELFTSTKI